MIQATPSTWRMLLDHDGRVRFRPAAGCCAAARRWRRTLRGGWCRGRRGLELYGPTETTVWSARHRLDAQDDRPVLGGPIGNTTLHILDNDLNLRRSGSSASSISAATGWRAAIGGAAG